MSTDIQETKEGSLLKRSAFDDFDRFVDRIFSPQALRSRFADEFFSDFFSGTRQTMPKIDVIEHKKEFVIKAEMPGMEKDDIDIKVNHNSVTIRGDLKQEETEEKENYCQKEIRQSHYFRNLPLPAEIDENNVQAKFKNGVVTLTLHKAKQTDKHSVKIE